MTSLPEAGSAGIPPEPVLRLSVEQYHAMIRAGILDEDSRVELLEGWLVPNVSKNPPHMVCLQLLQAAVARMLPLGVHTRLEGPVTLGDSEPEPDLAVVRGVVRDYSNRHPHAAEIVLAAEIADATLLRDRTVKKRIYARAGIPVYWIVDLQRRRVLEFREAGRIAGELEYSSQREFGEEDAVPLIIDGLAAGRIAVADILP